MSKYIEELIDEVLRTEQECSTAKRNYIKALADIIDSVMPDSENVKTNMYDNGELLKSWGERYSGSREKVKNTLMKQLLRRIEDDKAIVMWVENGRLYIKDTIDNDVIYAIFQALTGDD